MHDKLQVCEGVELSGGEPAGFGGALWTATIRAPPKEGLAVPCEPPSGANASCFTTTARTE